MILCFFLFNIALISSSSVTTILSQTSQQLSVSFTQLGIDTYPYYQVSLNLLSPSYSETLLAAKLGSAPTSSSITEFWTTNSDLQDNYSWVSMNSSHYLFLSNSSNWYLGIFTYSISTDLVWNLTITGSGMKYLENAVCLKSCSGHGVCSAGICNCYLGWVGNDCSMYIDYISYNQNYLEYANASQYRYFYLVNNYTSSCSVTKQSPELSIFIKQIDTG